MRSPMKKKQRVSRECVDRLHSWIDTHCPCALEQPDFLRGLLRIVEDERADAIVETRKEVVERLARPSSQ